MITSPDAFFIFSKFWFSGLLRGLGERGGKGQKMAQNDKKKLLSHSVSQNCTSYGCCFWYTCVKWWYLQQFFFHFFKILIFRVFSKFINKCQNEILRCVPPSSIVCYFYYIMLRLKYTAWLIIDDFLYSLVVSNDQNYYH